MSSERPKAILNQAVAAINCLADAAQVANPVNTEIYKLVSGLIKCEMTRPMQRSKAMPIKPFMEMFQVWPGNWFLTIEDLRLKCISLMALSMMLCPSDLAPRAKVFDEEHQIFHNLTLTTDNVMFHMDRSMTVTLFGIKNDFTRDGFEVISQLLQTQSWILSLH